LSTVSSASDKGIVFSAVGKTDATTVLVLDGWFDRYSGRMSETLSAEALRIGVLTGNPIYTVPNDGNREQYSILSTTTDGNWAINSDTGAVSVTGDVSAAGIVRIADDSHQFFAWILLWTLRSKRFWCQVSFTLTLMDLVIRTAMITVLEA
jgi:hypothetical protein